MEQCINGFEDGEEILWVLSIDNNYYLSQEINFINLSSLGPHLKLSPLEQIIQFGLMDVLIFSMILNIVLSSQ